MNQLARGHAAGEGVGPPRSFQDYLVPELALKPLSHNGNSKSFLVFFLSFFAISWAAPMAYGGSQARGLIGAVATSLRQSHSNAGSEPRLQPTPQFTATPDR